MRALALPLLVLSWLSAGVPAASAGEASLLSASTETASPGEVRPPAPVVRRVLAAIDKADVEQMDDCLAEAGGTAGDYSALLRAVAVPAGKGRRLWFVRPALTPYCHALYGAHLFRYFLVEEARSSGKPHLTLRFQDGGDAFTIYRTRHNGLNDIEAVGCIATECRALRLSFDGRAYRPAGCARLTHDDRGQEVREPRACGADGDRDDQASGFSAHKPD